MWVHFSEPQAPYYRRPKLAARLMSLHQQTALVGLVAIAVHGITLLGDHWLDPGILGITVPFVIDHEPIFTGLGIICALFATLAVMEKDWPRVFAWLGLALLIDGIDGTFARIGKVA